MVLAGHFASRLCCFASPPGPLPPSGTGIPVRARQNVDTDAKHSLPPRGGWGFIVAGRPYHFPHPALRSDLLEIGERARQGILYSAFGSRDRADRRFCLSGSLPFLFLLGSHADSDGAADRHVRPRAEDLCRREILSVHHDCFHVHAGGDTVAVCKDGYVRFYCSAKGGTNRPDSRFSERRRLALSGLLCCLRCKGPAVSISYLAAGCPRRSADRRFRPSRGRAAEDGDLRNVALQPRTVPSPSAS